MNVFYLIVLTFLVFQNIYPQKISDSLILKGLNASYNFEFEKAENIFSQLIKENPEHPAGYYFTSQIYFWKYIGGNDKGDKGIFLKYADLSIKKSEDGADKKELPELYFFLGSSHQLKALALMYEGEFFDAYGDAKDAVNNLNYCLKLNPEFYDAYLGLGIFNYTLSYVPSFYRFLLGIFGLSSNKEEGFNWIITAAEKGKFNKYEALFYKARILSDYTADYNSSLNILRNLLTQFPDNIVINYQYALTSLLKRDINNAENSLNKIIKISNPEFIQTNSFAYLRMGDIQFIRNNFDQAIISYEKFLNDTRSFEFSGYAYYQIALCFAFMGNDNEMKRNLIFARNGNTDIPEDYYAKEKSEYFFDQGFPKEYLNLIKIENLLFQKKYSNAAYILNELYYGGKITGKFSGKADYIKSQILFSDNNFTGAIKSASKIELENIKIDRWILPSAKLLIAESYFELKDYKKSEEYKNQALEINEYEFKELIESKIRNIELRLSKSKNNVKNVK